MPISIHNGNCLASRRQQKVSSNVDRKERHYSGGFGTSFGFPRNYELDAAANGGPYYRALTFLLAAGCPAFVFGVDRWSTRQNLVFLNNFH